MQLKAASLFKVTLPLPSLELVYTCSKSAVETQERYVKLLKVNHKDTINLNDSGDFIDNFQQISPIVLVWVILVSFVKFEKVSHCPGVSIVDFEPVNTG